MKVLLCTVPLDRGAPRNADQLPMYPKIAIVSIIHWMRRSGYDASTCDFLDIDMLDLSDAAIKEYFKKTQPTVICLSAVVSTSYSSVKSLASIAREVCPNSWIVMGGYLSASAEVVLNKTEVDICVRGDGEIPFVKFLDYVKKFQRKKVTSVLSMIPGVAYLEDNGQFIANGEGESIPDDAMCYPDYDILLAGCKDQPHLGSNYFRDGLRSDWFSRDVRSFEKGRGIKCAAFWISKGCVAQCTFCQRGSRKLHRFSLTKLEEHLQLLVQKYDVGFVHVMDENFGADKRHTYEVVKLFNKYNLLWICSGVRCNNVTVDDVKFYHDAGCCGLKFGVESGSQKILDIMEKRFSADDVRQAIKYCVQYGVYSPMAVMVGMPGETDQTVRATGELIGELSYLQGYSLLEVSRTSIFYAFALPGTPLYEYSLQVGVIGSSMDAQESYLISVSDKGANKENYINLNGSPMSAIVFWDMMLKLEAFRAWHKLARKNKQYSFHDETSIAIHGMNNRDTYKYRLIQPIKQGIKNLKGRSLWDILVRPRLGILSAVRLFLNLILSSRFMMVLPRRPLYFILCQIIYMHFLLQKMRLRYQHKKNIVRGRTAALGNLYKNYKFPKQISESQLLLMRKKNGSLRALIPPKELMTVKESVAADR